MLAGLLNAGIAFTINSDIVVAVSALVATVGVTLTVVSWIDKRIDHKIRNYANIVKMQHVTILREISSLRELGGHPPLNINAIMEAEIITLIRDEEEERKAG